MLQLKGKAAIDVVCNPLGKSGGSAIQQVMIITFGSLASSTPYLGVILLGIVLIWLQAQRAPWTGRWAPPCCQHEIDSLGSGSSQRSACREGHCEPACASAFSLVN